MAKIIKGDTVKIISGQLKGTTGKVLTVLTKKQAVLIENIGIIKRKLKPTPYNPNGGQKTIHTPVPIQKIALVIDQKSEKTSRVGHQTTSEGKKIRVARQNGNKEIA